MRRSMLDGPHVGVGRCFMRENLEGVVVVECQCCHVKPGTGQVITTVTGETSSVLVESVLIVYNMLKIQAVAMANALGQPGQLPGIHKSDHDLHVHVVGPGIPIGHTSYMAATVLSMVSLLLGQRPPDDVGAVGEVNEFGVIDPTFQWTAGEVRACHRLGLRRMVVSVDEVFEEEALVLAGQMMEDGRPMVEFLRFERMMEAMAAVFGTPTRTTTST